MVPKFSKLEQMSFIKYLVVAKCKSCEIYRRMCDVYEEAYSPNRIFINGLDTGLLWRAWVEQTVH